MSHKVTIVKRPGIRIGGVPPPSLTQSDVFRANPEPNIFWTGLGGRSPNVRSTSNLWFHTGLIQTRIPDDTPTTKYYCEVEMRTTVGEITLWGMVTGTSVFTTGTGGVIGSNHHVYRNNGQKGGDGSYSSYGDSYTVSDFIGMLFDCATGDITFFKNGISQGVAFTIGTAAAIFPQGSIHDPFLKGIAWTLHTVTQAAIPDIGEVSWLA